MPFLQHDFNRFFYGRVPGDCYHIGPGCHHLPHGDLTQADHVRHDLPLVLVDGAFAVPDLGEHLEFGSADCGAPFTAYELAKNVEWDQDGLHDDHHPPQHMGGGFA